MAVIMYNFNKHTVEYHDISSSAIYFDGTTFYISPVNDYRIVKFLTEDGIDYTGEIIETELIVDIAPETRNVKKIGHKIEADFDGNLSLDAVNENDVIGASSTLGDYREMLKFNLPFEVLTLVLKGFDTLRSLFVEYFVRIIKNKKEG